MNFDTNQLAAHDVELVEHEDSNDCVSKEEGCLRRRWFQAFQTIVAAQTVVNHIGANTYCLASH